MIEHIRARLASIEARFSIASPTPPPAPPAAPAANFAGMLARQSVSNSGFTTLGQMWGQQSNDIGMGSYSGYGGYRDVSAPAGADRFRTQFEAAGARYGVDPSLLAAVAWTESGFNPDAVSHAGALGLMQIMPGTAAGLGVDPRDPIQAIDGAARYLRQQLDRFGDVSLALAAYNAGPGAVQQYGGIPPYEETISYVGKVQGRYDLLRSSR